jgi:hypothetical protein
MTILARTLKFRTQPLEIEAVRFDGSNAEDVIEWVGSDLCEPCAAARGDFIRSLLVTTPEGARRADTGDWIIKEGLGVFYPLKADLFETRFMPAEKARANSCRIEASTTQ